MRRSVAAIGIAAALVTACTPKVGKPSAGRPQEGATPSPHSEALTSPVIHARFLTPGSDVLFSAESMPPTTVEGWTAVEAGAKKVIDGAIMLQAGSQSAGRPQWLRIAKAVEDGAQKSAQAARAGNADALAAADGEFTAQCEDCHRFFRDTGGGMMSKP